jgi:hypothetical protein
MQAGVKKASSSGPCQIFGPQPLSGIGKAGTAILANHRLNTSYFCLQDRRVQRKTIVNEISILNLHKYSVGLLLFQTGVLY